MRTENMRNTGRGKSGSLRQVKEELDGGCTRGGMKACAGDEDIVTNNLGGGNEEE